MKEVVYLSFAVASIAFTVTETKLFKPFRDRVKRRNSFFGSLLLCGYCFGHWLAFILVAIYKPRLLYTWSPLDYFFTAIVIAWLSAFQWVTMCWLMKKTGK